MAASASLTSVGITTFGKIAYCITNAGFLVIRDSAYDYTGDPVVMMLVVKLGKVILDNDFNAPIPFIVDGVSVLICGQNFKQPLDNLPSSLRVLQLGNVRHTGWSYFPHSLTNLPHGIEDLRILPLDRKCSEKVITKDLCASLPSSLKYLTIILPYNPYSSLPYGTLDLNKLPDSLEEIHISDVKNVNVHLEDVFHLPANLKLFCGASYSSFPAELKAKFPYLQIKYVNDDWLKLNEKLD